ncbi:hypothetical protein DXG03_004582 [Asterophora parasitica]|uniref:Uncharacterized protein n=1 Tax=Asterophora parasitica TaxID=117018 RepID=A0A9P7G9Y9_9AGAR|nr:hypothetical protein DXG03_004582 [Asterophora parasitica]
MSTTSLPSYIAPSLNRAPSYSAEPQEAEQRLALVDRLRPRPTGNFVKQSKNGDARLRLTAQEADATLPTYGSQGSVEGVVELSKLDNIVNVEVKVSGSTFGGAPPLPPTFDVKLKGLPGFTANIDVISTPFVYHPRTRPPAPLPSPLVHSRHGFTEAPGWTCYQSEISARGSGDTITTKFYVPASRVFWISQPIPFHVTFESSAQALTTFLPYTPTVGYIKAKQATRVQLMRQSTVDVRYVFYLWRLRQRSGGDSFLQEYVRIRDKDGHGDGPTWTSFNGEITISDSVKVPGFKSSGLSVKDCILFSTTPPDLSRAPFHDLRQVIPVRLTTDAWADDGTGVGANHRRTGSDHSVASLLDYAEETDTSTSPGDGAEVHSAQAAPNVDEVGQPHTSPKVPFKEQVLGAAKVNHLTSVSSIADD